ncbi:tautomerase family protein [Humibacter albus]|uniref:tautomerase family protein n=1 Tax=Humibacter albus TaxID=427754 RepID=UPI0003B57004|nr:tautomerase family protein [Humibacter albus]
MPLVRVDLHASLADSRAEISRAIHDGLVSGLPMPADDLFQIFRLHEPGDLVYTTTFPDAARTDIVYIQILLANIYQPEDKQRMYDAVVGNLVEVGIKPDNVLIALTENAGSDWFAPSKDWQPTDAAVSA